MRLAMAIAATAVALAGCRNGAERIVSLDAGRPPSEGAATEVRVHDVRDILRPIREG